MELTYAQYDRPALLLLMQRGTRRVSNLHVLSALLEVAEQGCRRTGFSTGCSNPSERSGSDGPGWRRWRWTAPACRFIPTGRRAPHGPQANDQSCGDWTTKIQMVAAEARTAVALASG